MWWWFVQLTHVSLPNKLIFIIVTQVFSSGDFWRRSDSAAPPHKGTLWDGSIFGDHYLHSSACMRQRRVTEESLVTLLQISINNTASVWQAGLCPSLRCHLQWRVRSISYVRSAAVDWSFIKRVFMKEEWGKSQERCVSFADPFLTFGN